MLKEGWESLREVTGLGRTDAGLANKIAKLKAKLALLHAEELEVGLTENLERKIDTTESLLTVFEKIQTRRMKKRARAA